MDSTKIKRYGIYRGIVVDNNDTGVLNYSDGKENEVIKPFGRCKIFFEGIYPEAFRENFDNLPWAEPVYPLWGGNSSNAVQENIEFLSGEDIAKNYSNPVTGWSSVPHIGTYVWGFFEDGNIQYPKFFGVSQVGPMYLAEHKNQHVIATDNVKIVIDEEPENVNSTNRVDSANDDCTATAKAFAEIANLKKKNMPTTVNITIVAEKPEKGKENEENYCAINLNIIGNVNANIKGHIYENHEGDKFITQKGNLYHKIEGDIEIEHVGYIKETHKFSGDGPTARDFIVSGGDNNEIYSKNKSVTISGNSEEKVGQNRTATVCANETVNATGVLALKGSVVKLN